MVKRLWNRILCRILGHIPIQITAEKRNGLRILPAKKCARCGRYKVSW